METRLTLTINKRFTITTLLMITFVLLIANSIAIYMRLYTGHDFVYGLVPLFDFNLEANMPSLFSTLLLFASAILAGVITKLKYASRCKDSCLWAGIALGFAFLAVDESVGIHELLSTPLREGLNLSGIFYYAWILPYGIIGIIIAFLYARFLFRLAPKIRNLLLLSGFIFLGGGIGMELIGGSLADTIGHQNITYAISYTIEELLEMLGVIGFIYSFLTYIEVEYQSLRCEFVYNRS